MKQEDFEKNKAIRSLPKQVRQDLVDFIYKEIPSTKFLQPDGNPRKEWKLVYGIDWGEASSTAFDEAMDKVHKVNLTKGTNMDNWWHLDMVQVAAWDEAKKAAKNAGRYKTLNFDVVTKATRQATQKAVRKIVKTISKDWYNDAYISGLPDSAADDASLLARFKLVADIKFSEKQKYFAYAKARWEAWQKGYGVERDVNGVLYVFAPEQHRKLLQ